MTASPGDGEHAAREGYYPDPSIPGFVRYWNGAAWVPGTSRPAPKPPADETGPVFLDETSATEALPEPEPEPAVWQADPLHQAGFGGPRDDRVSWGNPEPEPGGGRSGISLARTPEPRLPAQAAAGILSARSPASHRATGPAGTAQATPAQAWPDAPGAGTSGATTSWPGASDDPPRREPREPREPRSGSSARPAAPAAPEPPAEPWEPRTGGARPSLPGTRPESRPAQPAARPAAPVEPARQEPWEPRGGGARPSLPGGGTADRPRPEGARTPRDVFEAMAERAVRPAGLTRRALARALDSLVLTAVAAVAGWSQLPAATAHLEAKVDAARAGGRATTVWLLDGTIAGHLGLVLAAVLVFGILYEALPTARWGRTPGKRLLGVRVLATATLRPPSFGAALRRWLVYALLGLPGSLWCLVDRPRRQAWHDKAAKTYVAR